MKGPSLASRAAHCLWFVLLWIWNHPRMKSVKKFLYNFKLTVICGVITLLVFRGTIGAGKFGTLAHDVEIVNYELKSFQENRLLQSAESQKLLWEESAESRGPYSLGPPIQDWDFERRRWIAADPGCNETADGRPKVMIVSGSQPTPCEYNVGDHLLTKFLKTKMDYARIKKMRIYYHMVRLDKEMTGLWAKLPLLRRLMVAHPEIEWFWWMDPDAAITDMKFEMPWKKYSKYNLIVPGWEELVYKEKDWVGLSTGSFLLRNSQWSVDLLEEWSKMGVRGKAREDAGKLLTANLKGRPSIPADDQSALVYLLLKDKKRWGSKTLLENKYYLHGYWVNLVDKFESIMAKNKPGYGDDRWPFVIHFVGCQLCGAGGDYDAQKCMEGMARTFNFADNQVIRPYGYKHLRLNSSILLPTNETTRVTIVETHFQRKRLQKAMKKNLGEAIKELELTSVSDDAIETPLPHATEGVVDALVSDGVLAKDPNGRGVSALSVVPKKPGQSVAWGKTPGQSAADWRDKLEDVDEEELQEKKLEEAESKLLHDIEGKHLAEEEAEEEKEEREEDGAAKGTGEDSTVEARLKAELVKEGGQEAEAAAEQAEEKAGGKSAIELGADTSSEEDVENKETERAEEKEGKEEKGADGAEGEEGEDANEEGPAVNSVAGGKSSRVPSGERKGDEEEDEAAAAKALEASTSAEGSEEEEGESKGTKAAEEATEDAEKESKTEEDTEEDSPRSTLNAARAKVGGTRSSEEDEEEPPAREKSRSSKAEVDEDSEGDDEEAATSRPAKKKVLAAADDAEEDSDSAE